MSIQDVDDEGGGLGQGQAELLDESFEVAALQWARGKTNLAYSGRASSCALVTGRFQMVSEGVT